MDNPWTDSTDSDDDDGMQLETKERDDHLIILVDCNSSYFEPNYAAANADDEGKHRQPQSFFTFAMCHILNIYRRKIIENPTSKLAVVFFGTRASNNADGFANIYVAVDARRSPQHEAVSILDRPEAASIRKLKHLASEAYVAPGGSFEREVGLMDKDAGHPPPLRNALWFCALQFNKEKATNVNSKIWLFTNNDSPYRAGQHDHDRSAALTCAADLAEMDRTLTLWYSHPSPEHAFDLSVFYHQLINSGTSNSVDGSADVNTGTSIGNHEMAGADDDGEPLLSRVHHDATYTTLLEAETSKIQRRHFKKRAMASVPLILRKSSHSVNGVAAADDGASAGDIRLRVQLFKLVARAKRPPAVTVDTTRYQPLGRETQIVCKETGQVLQPQQIRTYVSAGGEQARVYMGKHENEQHKDTAERGLTVLGFQPLSSLKSAFGAFFSLPYNIGSSVFIYPHETAVVGSTTAFIALQRAMLQKRQFAVVAYRPRRKAMPRRAALLPQVEEVMLQPLPTGATSLAHSTHSTQVAPPGMQLIPLPFHEEYRSLCHVSSVSNPRHASVEQVQAARSVVRALPTFNAYEPECFANPSMAKFWAHLEALALEEDMPRWQSSNDNTCPPPNFLELGGSGCAQLLADLEALYDNEPDKLQNRAQIAGKKRRSSALGVGRITGASAVKRKYTLEDIDTLPWDRMLKDNEVTKQTVNTLRLYCELHQLQKTGRKADLVTRVSDHLYRLQSGLDVQEAANASGKDCDFEASNDDEEAAPRYRRGIESDGVTCDGGGGYGTVGGSIGGSSADGGDCTGAGDAARAKDAAYEYDSADDMFND